MSKGFCLECARMYDDNGLAYNECPQGHPLLHAQAACKQCGLVMYFRNEDDYIGVDSDSGVICHKCVMHEL